MEIWEGIEGARQWTSWASQQDIRWPSFTPKETIELSNPKSSSYSDQLYGLGPSSPYVRQNQNSSPAPASASELSPSPRLSPAAPALPASEPMEFATSTRVFNDYPITSRECN